MKKNLFIIRNVAIGLGLSIANLLICSPSMAKKINYPKEAVSKITPSVEFIGTDKEGSIFLVKISSDSTASFNVSINGDDGELLYTESFKTDSLSKYIKLKNEGSDLEGNLSFTIKTTTGEKHTFSVVNSQKVVNDVVITRL